MRRHRAFGALPWRREGRGRIPKGGFLQRLQKRGHGVDLALGGRGAGGDADGAAAGEPGGVDLVGRLYVVGAGAGGGAGGLRPSIMQRWDYFKRAREIRPQGFTYTSKGNKERRREK